MKSLTSSSSPLSQNAIREGLTLLVFTAVGLWLAQFSGMLDHFRVWSHSPAGQQADRLVVIGLVVAVVFTFFVWQRWQESRQTAIQLHHETEQWQLLQELGQSFPAELTSEELPVALVQNITRLTQWQHLLVAQLDNTGKALVIRAASEPLWGLIDETIPLMAPLIGQTFLSRKTQVASDLTGLPTNLRTQLASYPAGIAVPLQDEQNVYAVLVVLDSPADQLSQTATWLEFFARPLGLIFAQARQKVLVSQKTSALTLIHNITALVNLTELPHDTYQESLRIVLQKLGFHTGRLLLVEQGELRVVAERGLEAFAPLTIPHTLCQHALQRQEVLLIPHLIQSTTTVARLWQEIPEIMEQYNQIGLRSYVSIPLVYRSQTLGLISLFDFEPRSLSQYDQTILGNIGRQIGLAIAATRAHEEAIQGQAWLRAVVENAPEGVLLLTNSLTIKAVSPVTFTLVTGSQTDPAGWRGKKLEDLLALSPEGVKGWGAMVNQNSLNQHAPMEGTHPSPGRILQWRWTPLWQYGQPLGWLLRLQDVTQAQRQTQLHNELIQMTIHDLRNPLSALDGCLTMIEDSDRPLPTKELFQVMRRSLQGMQELVDTILDVNQLENGKLSLHIMPFSLSQVIEEVLETQTVLVKQHELTLHTEFPAELPLAWGDPLLLRRVVQNLCDNAIKFTPRGGHITWQIAVQQIAGAQKLLVTVKDSGLGIPTELQQRIFQEFSAGRHQQRGGNGLGLTFCKMALEVHGEQITVQSEPGRGTTFVFTLATQPLSLNGHLGDLFNTVRYAS